MLQSIFIEQRARIWKQKTRETEVAGTFYLRVMVGAVNPEPGWVPQHRGRWEAALCIATCVPITKRKGHPTLGWGSKWVAEMVKSERDSAPWLCLTLPSNTENYFDAMSPKLRGGSSPVFLDSLSSQGPLDQCLITLGEALTSSQTK